MFYAKTEVPCIPQANLSYLDSPDFGCFWSLTTRLRRPQNAPSIIDAKGFFSARSSGADLAKRSEHVSYSSSTWLLMVYTFRT